MGGLGFSNNEFAICSENSTFASEKITKMENWSRGTLF